MQFCAFLPLQSARGVWRQSNSPSKRREQAQLQSARGVWRQRLLVSCFYFRKPVAICTGRVEAKIVRAGLEGGGKSCNLHGACGGKGLVLRILIAFFDALQSARGVWRQSSMVTPAFSAAAALQSARGVWRQRVTSSASGSKTPQLQSARGVWRQRVFCVLTTSCRAGCNLHGACGGKEHHLLRPVAKLRLQSARGVWRQSLLNLDTDGFQRGCNLHGACGGKGESTQMVSASRLVAICTGRVEAKVVLDCYLCDISVAICTGRVEAKGSGAGNTVDARSCNLHGACGGKGALQFHPYY